MTRAGARRSAILLALLLACTPLLPDRAADAAIPPPPRAAPLFPAAAGEGVLITRVYPNAPRDDEFIEIENSGAGTVEIGGWALTDREDTATFPKGTRLGPGSKFVATRNATSYAEDVRRAADFTYDRGDAPRMSGGVLRLADGGDEVLLLDANESLVDAYVYGASTYAGPGWMGNPARAPGRGIVAARVFSADGRRDHDNASDWEGLRELRLGQSAFDPPPVEAAVEPIVLVSPDDGRARLLSFLASADRSLEVAVYTLTSPSITAVLADRARAGVRVRVLLEGAPVGGVDDGERSLIGALLDAGAEVRWLASAAEAVKRYRYLHAKFAVVDGSAVLVSSENFGDSGFPLAGESGNRGWSLLVEDRIFAGQLWEVFEEDFDPSRADSIRADEVTGAALEPIAVLPWTPGAAEGSRRLRLVVGPDTTLDEDGLLSVLASARQRIWIEAFYADAAWSGRANPFLEAAFAAARRGVAVRILLDGSQWSTAEEDASGNDALAVDLNHRARTEGLDLEVRLLTPRGPIERLHNKGAIVDGRIALVSSMNWAHGSATDNREIGVLVDDPDVAKRLEEAFLQDWDGPSSGSPEEPAIRDPVVVVAMYVFVAAASALSLRKMRRRNKGLKPRRPMKWRALLRTHLGRGHREVRVLSPELVAESGDGARGGTGDRGGGAEAHEGLGGPERD